jgi:isopenicillin-N epimerase
VKRADRVPFLCDFDYVGTNDYTANLVIPDAIDHVGSQVRGGWAELMQRNHEKIIDARTMLCERTGVLPLAPEAMIGSMASLLLPRNPAPDRDCDYDDPLQDALLKKHQIQVPVWEMPPVADRVMRISAQLYNTRQEYEALAIALRQELDLERERVTDRAD